MDGRNKEDTRNAHLLDPGELVVRGMGVAEGWHLSVLSVTGVAVLWEGEVPLMQ
jgi:hypothetical protein